jgi:hypothetical protein
MNLSELTRHTALLGLLCSPVLLAQSITISAAAHNDLSVSATTENGKLARFVTPAGTQLPSCFALTTEGPVASPSQASIGIATTASTDSLTADLKVTAWTPGGGAGSAGSGLSQVLVQVDLAFAMTLDLEFHGTIIVCGGPPTGKVAIDIGNDGSNELEITAQTASFEEQQGSLVLTLPAGTTDIMVTTELDLSPMDASGGFVEIAADITVKPGHTTADSEGSACGAELEVTPMFNGNVRFTILDEQAGDVPFLALGGARQQLPLPISISPGCNLLITPDWFVPLQPFNPHFIPLICMGTGQLFAQAAIYRQSSSGSFRMSQRVAIEVR